jgi:DNA polymerase-3 subunit gamma/tau
MPYEITATRKRPQGFEELAGQDFVSATLEASLSSGRIAHAYLFSGPRGCGKTSTARILAKALNCEKGPTATPCGECASCKAIAAGSSLDVIEIDGASNTSVDNVRQIKDEVLFPPNGGRFKVYIIDEVHMLSMSAFNALLKTIEEPPPYIVFIFATTELHKVPATIKSRCQQFAFRLVPIPTIKGLLATAAKESGAEADDDALLWIAKESGGSPRDAYTLFDQVLAFSDGHITAAKIRDKLGIVGLDAMNDLFESLVCREASAGAGAEPVAGGSVGSVPAAAGSAREGLEALDAILERGVSPEQLVLDAVEYCRALLLLKNGLDRESLLGASPQAFSPRVLEALNAEQIERALAELLELHRSIRFTVDPRFELELAAARLARLPDYISATELAKTVSSLRRRIAAGGGMPAGATANGAAGAANAGAFAGGEVSHNAASRGAAGPEQRQPSPGAGRPLPEDRGQDASEKKKPELPKSLKSAFSSLAAIVGSEDDADDDERPASEPSAPVAAVQKGSEPGAGPGRGDMGADPGRGGPGAPDAAGSDDEDDLWEPNPTLPPDAEGSAPASEEGVALKKAVLEAIGRSSPLLGTGLVSSLPWIVEDCKVVIPFRSGMEESVVKGELPTLAQVVTKVTGRALKVELKVAQTQRQAVGGHGPGAAEGPGDAADLVARVFRGQRIQPRKSGGSNGL